MKRGRPATPARKKAPLPAVPVSVIRPRTKVSITIPPLPPALRGLWAPGVNLLWDFDLCFYCGAYGLCYTFALGVCGCEACAVPPTPAEVRR